MHVMSPVQQASLEYGKAYIQQIEILHYIDFVKKKYDLNTVVWIVALLYSDITSRPHPSQHVAHYITIITNLFGKLNSFLQTYVISKNT